MYKMIMYYRNINSVSRPMQLSGLNRIGLSSTLENEKRRKRPIKTFDCLSDVEI